jgi:hypothetical protein
MINPHDELRQHLKSFGYTVSTNAYGDDYYDDKIFEHLEIGNPRTKGGLNNPNDYDSRFMDILSDPNNLFIDRHKDAGLIHGDTITLHNGIIIHSEYYGDFINILKYNLGVHEPSEERAFQKVLNVLGENSTMVELGSYWSMYSIWFMKTLKNSKSFCVEPEQANIELGKKNFILNDLEYDITQGEISEKGINLANFLLERKISQLDLLHSDIQGQEYLMLQQIEDFIINKKIKYLFISTHSNDVHNQCINYLKKNDYKILCSCDFDNETFQYDGFILSCPNTINEIKPFLIGNRSKSKIITENFYKNIKK